MKITEKTEINAELTIDTQYGNMFESESTSNDFPCTLSISETASGVKTAVIKYMDENGSDCIIRLQGHRADIFRKQQNSLHLKIIEGAVTNTVLRMPFGDMPLDVHGRSVKWKNTDGELTARISYFIGSDITLDLSVKYMYS